MKPERYFSVDVESAGPIPGKYSMLSLGACVVGDPSIAFYSELKPITEEFVPEAMAVTGLTLEQLKESGQDPEAALKAFCQWVEQHAAGFKPVFVGFNACYDWQFVNWYLHTYAGTNPFGFGGIDIKSYYMGIAETPWGQTTSSQLPVAYQPDTPQTHNALEDARAQASIFTKLLAARAKAE